MLIRAGAQPNETTVNGNFSGLSGACGGRTGAKAIWSSALFEIYALGRGLWAARVLACHLIDNALDNDHLNMHVASNIG
jgi:hypothetical protein